MSFLSNRIVPLNDLLAEEKSFANFFCLFADKTSPRYEKVYAGG
jgi:hypothetical protein